MTGTETILTSLAIWGRRLAASPRARQRAVLLALAILAPACGSGGGGSGPVPFGITTTTVPSGVVGTAYTATTLTTQAATGAVTWSVIGGSLPPGLTLNPVTGTLSGTPTGSASFNTVKIRALDASGVSSDALLFITVTGGAPAALTLTTATPLPGGDQSSFYHFGFSASGGAPGYTWAVTAGTPPPGLTLNPANGGLSGVPTTLGTFNFTVKVTDLSSATSSLAYDLTIYAPLQITTASLAAGTVGAAYNHSVAITGGAPPIGFALTSGTLPAGLLLDTATGAITGTPTVAATSNFVIRVTDLNGSQAAVGLAITINPVPSITTAVLPPSTLGLAYSHTLTGTGGTLPYTWSVSAGALPTGLSLSSAGVITGTSSAAGPFGFTALLTDAAGATTSQVLSILINPAIVVTKASLSDWTQGRPSYSQTLTSTGGTGAITWSITGGTLPTGLSLNSATGVISGTPTVVGTSSFTAVATDSLGAVGSKPLSITIHLAPTISTGSLPNWTLGMAYPASPISVTNGTAAFVYSVTVGSLPAGLSLDPATGIVSGTPTTAATSNFTVTVIDAAGASTSHAYLININPVPVVATASVPNWSVNRPYPTQTMTLNAGTGTPPVTWAVTSGAAPTGLSLSAAGSLTGTPTATGPFTFTVTATDAAGATATKTFTAVTINPPPTIATALPDWTVGRAYSQTLLTTVATGTPSFTFAVTSGALPTGLSLSTAGVLSGTPTVTGQFTFTVTVTDTAGATGTRTYTNLTINPVPAVSTTTLPDWTVNRPYTQTLLTTAATGTSPFLWAVTSGAAPTSLTLSSGGVLSGTPSATGPFTFTVTVTDSAGATATQIYTALKINPVPVIATTSVPNWTVNRLYPTQTLQTTAATGTAPFTWAVTAGAVPTGLTLNSGGSLSGTPTANGTFSFTATVTDAAGATASQAYTSVLINPPPTIATTLGDWTVNRAVPSTSLLTTVGTGTPSFSYAVTAGGFPTGVTMSPAGLVSGTPTVTGPFSATVTVTDAAGATGSTVYAITINPPPTIATTTLPDWTVNQAYSKTLLTNVATGTAPFAWAVTAGAPPTGLTLSGGGVLSGTPSATGPFTFTVTVTDNAGATASQIYTAEKINPVPVVSTTTVPNWTVTRLYPTQTLQTTAATGTAPFTWAVTAGGLPTGLTLNSSGSLSGTPTVAGTYSFTATATDAAGGTASQAFTSVVMAPLPSIATALGDWTVNKAVPTTQLLTTAGTGTPGFSWAVTAGSFPTGVGLSGAGLLSGTPTVTGPYSATVTVTDAAGATGSRVYSYTINPPPTIATTTLPDWTANFAYSQTLLTTPATGTAPFLWSVSSGAPPTGLTLGSDGSLTGTPTATGQFTFTVKVTDTAGATATQTYTNETISPALSINSGATLPAWTRNFAGYSQSLTATGGTGGHTWSIAGGALPTGMSLSAAGAVTGTPTSAAGPYSFTAKVTDSIGASSTLQISMTLNAQLSITNGFPLAPWTQGKSGYGQTMTASGGTGSTTFSLNPGPLPPGLSLASNGNITGNPSTPGTYNFTVQVTDSLGATGSLGEQIVINSPVNITGGGPLAQWTQGVAGYSQSLSGTGGTGSLSWTVASGSFPTNLSLSLGGQITGTPTAAGNYNFQVQATDAVGATNQKFFSISINPPVAITTSSPLPDGVLSTFYTTVLSSSGGTGPITWGTAPPPASQPPPGVTMNTGGGLSGTPSSSGSFPFTVTATDSVGGSVSLPMSVFILGPLLVTTGDPLPAATGGTPYSAPALANTGGKPGYTWTLLSGTIPTGMGFTPAGIWGGTPAATNTNGMYTFTVRVTDSDGRTAEKTLSMTLSGGMAASLAQSPLTLPQATSGAAYDRGITATGGQAPYTWTTALFSPPGSGLSLQSNGHVTGGAGTPGTYTATSLVTDFLSASDSQTITVTINGPLSIATSNPVQGWTVSPPALAYNTSLTSFGGTGTLKWGIASGALPSGLSLNLTTGAITGAPSAAGTFAFTAQVTDSAGAVATKGLQIQINPPVSVGSSPILPMWDQNLPGYGFTLFANNGTGPFTWSKTSGTLPPGLGLDPSGLISGTPTTASSSPADFTFTVQVQDFAGTVDTKSVSIFINQPLQITTAVSLPGGTENVPYSKSVTASGGSGGYLFAMTGGTLPTGMSFTGGSFTGTPATGTAATYSPQITVTDSVGGTASKIFSLVVGNTPAVLTSTPDNLATNVNLDTNLVITFNMTMVKAEVESRFTLTPIAGSPVHQFFWDTPPANPNGNTLTVAIDTAAPYGVISADDLLADNTAYTWNISSGAHSVSALVMPAQTGQFTTIPDGTPPTIASITPDPRTGVLNNVTGFAVVFSEAMDTTGSNGNVQVRVQGGSTNFNASAGTSTGPMTVQWTDPTTLTIGFASPLSGNTGYRLEIQQPRDLAGNSMNSGGDFSILTSGTGAAAPFVTGTFPPDTATGVSRDAGIFIAMSEPFSPNVVSQISITGPTIPPQIRYELGKSDGPTGIQISPRVAWPASTLITVTIPVTVTNSAGVALAAPFSFSFTTGATGVGSNPIVIDDPFSTIKDATTDCNSYSPLQGEILFKDSLTGARIYLDDTTLVNSAISVLDPNGIPVKYLAVNPFGGGGEDAGHSLQISNRNGQGITSLQLGTTYTVKFNTSIAGSAGQTFAGATYTFTTIPDFNTLPRSSGRFNQFNTNTGPDLGTGITREVSAQVDFDTGGGSIFGMNAADASAGNTDYSTNGFVPGWITAGVTVSVQGFSNPANNGTFQVVSVTPGSPNVITVNNAAGVSDSTGSGQMGAAYGVHLSDLTPANTFSVDFPFTNGSFNYDSPGTPPNETGLTTSGNHVFLYTVTDGFAAHTLHLNKAAYFFTSADMAAFTLNPSDPTGGLTPTYTWSGTCPASVTALFIGVQDVTDPDPKNHFTVGGWVIPPSQISFTQPANTPLVTGHSYSWTLGFLHSADNTIRDQLGGNGQMAPINFIR
jgi:hypothetical protein